jgi:hypothetical protein
MYGVAVDVGRMDHYTRFKSLRYAVTAVQYWGRRSTCSDALFGLAREILIQRVTSTRCV